VPKNAASHPDLNCDFQKQVLFISIIQIRRVFLFLWWPLLHQSLCLTTC